MKISIRFYAHLNFFIDPAHRQKRFSLEILQPGSIKDMIESQGVPHTEIGYLLVNGQFVGFDHLLEDRDNISVYPEFHTISIEQESKVLPRYSGTPRFILDAHLGKLAAYLRLLGFDTMYSNHMDDVDLAFIAAKEGRILLSRDRGLLKRKIVTFGGYVQNTDPPKQIMEIYHRFHLAEYAMPFTRCTVCNGILNEVSIDEVVDKLPEKTSEYIDQCWHCQDCHKLYWKGSHFIGIKKIFAEISALIPIVAPKTKEVTD